MRSFIISASIFLVLACACASPSGEEVTEEDLVALEEARAESAREMLDKQHRETEGYVVFACAAGNIQEEQVEVGYSLRTTYTSCSAYNQNQQIVFVQNPHTDGMYCSYLFLGPQSGSANFVLEPLDGGVFTAMSFSMPRVSGDYGRQDWVQQTMYATDGTYTFSADLQQRKEDANNGPHLSIAYRQAGQLIPTPEHVSGLDAVRSALHVGAAAMGESEGAVSVFPLRRNRTVIRFHNFDFDKMEVDSPVTN
jgi:hypothetical protein